MLLSAGGTVLLERLVGAPGAAGARRASASAAPRSRSRCSPGATAITARRSPRPSTLPAARSSGCVATKEPTDASSSRSGVAALAEILRAEERLHCPRPAGGIMMFGRIDHIGVAVEDLDAGAGALREGLRDGARPPRDGRVAGRRGGPARRRRRARRAAAAARPRHRGRQVPRPQGAGPAPRRLRRRRHRRDAGAPGRRRARADRQRAAGRHPRQPRRLPAPPLDRRRADRDRRTRGEEH